MASAAQETRGQKTGRLVGALLGTFIATVITAVAFALLGPGTPGLRATLAVVGIVPGWLLAAHLALPMRPMRLWLMLAGWSAVALALCMVGASA